jgi:hypothetical protein
VPFEVIANGTDEILINDFLVSRKIVPIAVFKGSHIATRPALLAANVFAC